MAATFQMNQARVEGKGGYALTQGAMVDHYKIMRPIGEGGMGEVYLARDTILGRKVALKMVHLDVIGTGDAAERFMFEAKATAQFSHPHIITVFGVGEYRGRPYVALEYLKGQNLRERIKETRLGLHETLRIGLAIAEALREAHGHQILHRDLKPENVFLPRDGRLRVLDFGLAKIISSEDIAGSDDADGPRDTFQFIAPKEMLLSRDNNIRGTPLYMSPEQWTENEYTGATDIWALGVLLYELLSGEYPFDEPNVFALYAKVCSSEEAPPIPDGNTLSPALQELVSRCLEKSPDKRPTAEQAVEILHDLVYGERRGPVDGERSPFRGLLPLTERHSDLFFGRENEVAEFIERLRGEPILPVVGPSGVGKSSFINAGVIPRLKEQGPWMILSIRPGRTPFETLITRLNGGVRPDASEQISLGSEGISPLITNPAFRPTADLTQETETFQALLQEPTRLALYLQQIAEQENARVLLFVDQLEELFTLVKDESVRRGFMKAVCSAADDPEGPVRVVFTLRDDFLVKMAEHVDTRHSLSKITVLRGLSGETLENILSSLINGTGYSLDDENLIPKMVQEVKAEPAALPLLQFAGQMLWERRDRKRRLVRMGSYEKIGGVVGALAHHADGVMAGMSPDEIQIARHIFLRLVTEDGAKKVVQRGALIQGLGKQAGGILDRLVETRAIIIRKGRHSKAGEAEVELVHEALIRAWGRLARWIEESRDDMGFLNEVGTAAALWERRGRRIEEVWQGEALYEALRKSERMSIVPEQVDVFLREGRHLEKRKQRRRFLLLSAAFFTLILVAVVLALQVREANIQRELAEKERVDAEKKRAEALREGAKTALIRDNLVEARAKLRLAMEVQDSPFGRALWWRLKQNPLIWKKRLGTNLTSVAFSPNGKQIAAAGLDGFAYLIDIKTRATQVLSGRGEAITSLSFSPDSRLLAGGTTSGHVGIWNPRRGSVTFFKAHDGAVTGITYHREGKWFATANAKGAIALWDDTTGQAKQMLLGHTGSVESIHFSPKGSLLASGGSDRAVRVWDWKKGVAINRFDGHSNTVTDVRFSPDGKRIASSSWDRTTRVWDTHAKRAHLVIRGHTDTVEGVDFSSDGKALVTSSSDRTVRLWNVSNGEEQHVLSGHTGFVYGVRFSPGESLLASVSSDGSARLWDTGTSRKKRINRGHSAAVLSADFSADGQTLVTASADRTIRFWEVSTARERRIWKGHASGLGSVAYSPDGQTLASAGGYDNVVRLWDVKTGVETQTLEGHRAVVVDMAFSPSGEHIASGGSDRTVRIWSTKEAEAPRVFKGHDGSITDVDFDHTGQQVISASTDKTVRIWHLNSDRNPTILRGHKSPIHAAAISPEGQSILIGGKDGVLRRFQLPSLKSDILEDFAGEIDDIAYHPFKDRVAVALSDGTARLVDLPSRKTTILEGHRKGIIAVRFDPAGKTVVTTGQDSTVRTWDSDAGRPYWRATALLGTSPGLLNHTGWHWPSKDKQSPKKHIKIALEQQARQAAVNKESSRLCLIDRDDHVVMWDLLTDKQVFRKNIIGVEYAKVAPTGCIVMTKHKSVYLVTGASTAKLLANDVAAITTDKDILLVVNREVLVFTPSGEKKESLVVNAGATAITRVWPWLIAGYEGGGIDFIPIAKGTRHPDFDVEETQASPVRLLEPGPSGTLIAGFADGTLGIWSLENGTRLHHVRLHGAIEHAFLQKTKLFAASDLGDFVNLDFGVFHQNYCTILKDIWRDVPVIWSGGRIVEQTAPQDHRCFNKK